MTADDQLTRLLRDLDRPAQPRPEFADSLLAQLLEAPGAAPERRPRRPARRLRIALVAAVVLALLAAAASAAYYSSRSPAPPSRPAQGQLTLPHVSDGGNGPSSITAVAPDGRVTTLWRCARVGFCGVIDSLAWSPDGKKVAFTLTETGGRSAYIGLHIVDLASGADIHIPDAPQLDPTKVQSSEVVARLIRQAQRRLGCTNPSDVAWSPDSRSIAYACPQGGSIPTPDVSRIFIIGADGRGHRLLHTGVRTALWPTWSPDGRRIAFASARAPRARVQRDTEHPPVTIRSSVYAVDIDGSHRRRLADDATAPSWSPDGRSIAYESACGGIALVSPAGAPLTPGRETASCAVIGRPGAPAWSPDGRQIAISWRDRLYVMHANGSRLTRLPLTAGDNVYGTGRPAWAPDVTATRRLQQKPDAQVCGGSCL